MKKIFTSISMALCLAASSFNASAQQATQLSDAQKQEIQQKVLPVVFEQIKEQAGIDILGWAQPKLTADYLESLPIFNQLQGNSGLRADATSYSVQPDSIKLDVTSLISNEAIVRLLGREMKITFADYQELDLSGLLSGTLGRGLKVQLPSVINVSTSNMQNLMEIAFTSNDLENGQILNLEVAADLNLLGSTTEYDLIGLTAEINSVAIQCDVDIRQGLPGLLAMMGGIFGIDASLSADVDYRLSIATSGLVTMVFPISLYEIHANAENPVSLGDATVSMDFSKSFPINYINITSYTDNTASAWNKMWFDLNQTEENVVLTIDNSSWTENWEDSTHVSLTTVTMTEYVNNATNAQAAVQSVVNRAVTELATTGVASRYEMKIETTVGDMTIRVMDVTVTPSIEGTNAVATINIQPYENGAASTPFDIVATADLAGSNVIAVDVVMGETTVGSAYFTSNIAGIVTDNEDIQLANVEVTPVKDGIYVSGTTAASYRIVSMSGAIVANGTVSGDNAYISTSALAKGIYVIVVTENGESKAIKFAR